MDIAGVRMDFVIADMDMKILRIDMGSDNSLMRVKTECLCISPLDLLQNLQIRDFVFIAKRNHQMIGFVLACAVRQVLRRFDFPDGKVGIIGTGVAILNPESV